MTPDDLSIPDVIAKLRRAAAERQRRGDNLLFRNLWHNCGAPSNTFHMLVLSERGWKGRWVEGFWPYEALNARN